MYHLELPYDELAKLISDFGHEVGIIQHHQYIKIHSLELDSIGRVFIAQCEVHEHYLH